MKFLLSILLAVAAVPVDEPPVVDVVEITDGKPIKGRVVFEGRDVLRVRTGRGEVEVDRARISQIHSQERNLKEFVRLFDAMPRKDAAASHLLAGWCKDHDLGHEATLLSYRGLLLDPEHEPEAKFAIVETRRVANKGLQLKVDGRWTGFDEFCGPKPTWKERLKLRTAHFEIESDLPLEPLLDAAVAVERHYQRFYDTLGPDIGLWVFDEVPSIRLYANAKDFPQSWTGSDQAWFAPVENVMHFLNGPSYDMQGIVRAVTDMLLFNACRRSSGKTGQIPGWMAAGISEGFAATAPAAPFEPWGELGTPNLAWFKIQAQAVEPLPLNKLLVSSLGEIRRGPDWERRMAAAYTLLDFIARGEDRALREKGFAYLRGAWQGKIDAKGFLKAMGMDEKELQRRWNEHVKQIAG